MRHLLGDFYGSLELLYLMMAPPPLPLLTIAFLLRLFLSAQSSLCVQYQVGGSKGWQMGTDYQSWASSITFKQGDTLYFKYEPNMHSVLEVSEQDYNTCNTRAPIRDDGGRGSDVVKLEAGTFYFICGLPGHCSEGHMKLMVHVQIMSSSTSSSSPPSTTNTPTSSSSSSYLPTPNLTFPIFLLILLHVHL